MSNTDMTMRIEATNIGPHSCFKDTKTMANNTIGIFAKNGSGKTTLSKTLRLADPLKIKDAISRTDNLISIGQTKGMFKFGFYPQHQSATLLSISMQKGMSPVIDNKTNYIFHVFSSDFVSENLAANNYSPDGNIEGFILGKPSIDISTHESKLLALKEDADKYKKEIEEAVTSAITDLDNIPIDKRTNEYKYITFENIYKGVEYQEAVGFSELLKKYTLIKSMPDNLTDVPKIQFEYDMSLFADIEFQLNTPYKKGQMTEEFKKKVRKKHSFVQEGLNLIEQEKDICPFCERPLNNDAIALIDLYNEYMHDEETRIIGQIEEVKKYLQILWDKLKQMKNLSFASANAFIEVRKYIPSLAEIDLPHIDDYQTLQTTFDFLQQLLDVKVNDIESTIDGFSDSIKKIKNYINVIMSQITKFNEIISAINDRKGKMDGEKLILRKRICIARYFELKNFQKDNLRELKECEDKVRVQEELIREETSKFKANKRDKVAAELKKQLDLFFRGKYVFDEEKFCVNFLDVPISDKADDILSDGEKNIVAFCYYIASTHIAVNDETEYGRLFFVVDDPVSSLDFYFVYSVAQVIRGLNKYFTEDAGVPVLVLTHSIEFMSILIRNKIVARKFVLVDGKLDKLGNELIMPYEEHLRDVSCIPGLV